jgi:hypothetical protein
MFDQNNNPYAQFGTDQYMNGADNFAQNNTQPYIEGVNQGQMGNPMLGSVTESSLYPIQSSTDSSYLNNNPSSGYANGGSVDNLANDVRSRLNLLGLNQLTGNNQYADRSNVPNYADGGQVDMIEEYLPEHSEDEELEDAYLESEELEVEEEYKPYHSLAEIIRQQGSDEDTILAHINPIEAAVLKSIGGSGTINPKTGLPQFGLFSNPKKWFKSTIGPAAGLILGNMVLPGLGGIIGGALGGAAGSHVRGRKDHLQSALRGGAMGAMAPSAASLLGSGASAMGATGVGSSLSNYGATNAILPSIGMGAKAGVESTASTVGGEVAKEGAKEAAKEAGKKAVEQSFTDKLMANGKDFFTQPSNIMSTAVLANQLIPQKEKKEKQTTPEEIAANEKRYRNAARLSRAELDADADYSINQRDAKRRARNKLYGQEPATLNMFRRVNSPQEYANTGRWLEHSDNPEFTGNPINMKEGGGYHPRFDYEIEEMLYPTGLVGFLQGYSGGQDDDVNAKLSDGEYIIDASTVSDLGDGNNANGAKKLDQMRRNIREHKRGGSINLPPKAKSLLNYMRG